MQRSFSDETFLIAADMVLRETKFFPVPKDIFDLRNSVYQAYDNRKAVLAQRDCKQLAEETDNLTEAEIENNIQKIEIIKRHLAGEMGLEEAVTEQQRISTYARE